MKLNLLIIVTMIVVGAALTLWLDGRLGAPITSAPIDTATPSTETDKTTAPDFSFTAINGQKFTLSDFRGKPVIIHFWATWCAPCVVEFPLLVNLAKEKKTITIIALSSDTTPEAITRFLQKYKLDMPDNFIMVHDARRKITADIFGTYKLPESLIINGNGLIDRKIIGDYDWKSKEIKDYLSALK